MNTMQTTAILVDDEPLVLDHLGRKLRRLWSELDILGEAHSGSEALAMIRELQPDIVFLDIHMPGLSGLDVAAVVSPTCQIVFVTAFDHYALEAFDRAAVDYLLKPVSDRRLVRTITKLKRDKGPVLADVQLLLQQMGESNKPNYLVWLRAGLDDVTELLSVDEVVFFRAEQKYTSVFTADKEHLIRMSLKDLEARLDPGAFWRVHRNLIVRVDQIAVAKRDIRGRYTLFLRERPESLRCSRAYGHLFKHM